MKANELRLGNLVIDGHDVEVVNYRMIEMLVKNQAEFDPIPLTEEWLLKFGFMKIDGSFFKLSFLFYGLKIKDAIGFQFRKGEFSIQLKYVHQLQNLYFALVGEELKLKEDESK